MKNKKIILIIFLSLIFFPIKGIAYEIIDSVDFSLSGCKYDMKYNNSSIENIIFYYDNINGFSNIIQIGDNIYEIENNESSFNIYNTLSNYKIIHLYLFTESLTNLFDKNINSCPSNLSYIYFGQGRGSDDYVLQSVSDNLISLNGEIDFVGKIDSAGKKIEEKSDRKNCGEAKVISLNSSNIASEYESQAVKIQYYTENNKYYVEMSTQKYTESGNLQTFELNKNNLTYVDFYKINYGGRILAVQYPSNCSNKIESCDQDDGDGELKTYVGDNCDFSGNGFEDTTHEAENVEEYIENYKRKHIDEPTPEVFDNCESLLGSTKCDGSFTDKSIGCLKDVKSPAFYLNFAFTIIKYLAIIALVICTILDFMKCISSQNQDDFKKAYQKAIKRLVTCIIIFILPIILAFILNYINDSAIGLCGIGGV